MFFTKLPSELIVGIANLLEYHRVRLRKDRSIAHRSGASMAHAEDWTSRWQTVS
jgi:hypothetical protein